MSSGIVGATFRIFRKSCGILLMAIALTSPAFADGDWEDPDDNAPEIDPGVVVSAITLVAGGVLLLTDRRYKWVPVPQERASRR